MPASYCCVDIETTGTSPDRAAIIQIAAVRFDLHARTIDHSFFNRCLTMPPTRCWEEGTRSWWLKNRPVLDGIFSRMEDHRQVMEEFFEWCGGAACDMHFLSKPLSFDFPFVSSYFREFGPGSHMPFDHRKGRDLRSMLCCIDPEFQENTVPFEGPQHDALFDALHQIKVLFAATDRSNR